MRRLAAASLACLMLLPQVGPVAAATPTRAMPGAAPAAASTAVASTGVASTGAARSGVASGAGALAPAAAPVLPASAAAPAQPASDIVPGTVGRTSIDVRATYDVQATLDLDTRALWVATTLDVENTSGTEIDRLELNTIAARLGGMRKLSASVDGTPVTLAVDDQTIIVPLGGVLPVGGRTRLVVAFRATLRSGTSGSDWLFTRANGVVDLYRWIPWVSLRRPFDRPNNGDPFITPVSPLVRVTIQTSRPTVMATTGRLVWATSRTHAFEATDVRDFVLTAASDFRTSSRRVGDVFVQAFVRPGVSASARADAAARAVSRMTARLGQFPVRSLLVVQSAGGYGMEGPGIIWIPGNTAAPNLSYLVAHETAHQWFYGSVGNDQASAPFVDEAAAEFLARNVLGLRRASRCSTGRLDLSIYRYSASCYYEIVYIQGGNLLDDTRKAMGDATFWSALRGYVVANRLALVGGRTLLDALDAATPLDLRARWFAARFPSWY